MGKDPYPRRVDSSAPRIPADAVLRPRLMGALDPLPPLTVLRAPGGSGKTVLASQAVTGRELVGAWVTVGPESSTRDGFWRDLLPRVLGADRAAMYLGGSESPSRHTLTDAFLDLGDVVVVVDDAHEFDDPAGVADDIVEIVRATPARFVVLTRTPVGRMEEASTTLRLDVARIGVDDLAFTPDEVRQLAPDGSVERLLAASGGNALLLRALVLDRDDSELPATTPGELASDLISGFVAELDSDEQHFLLRTSLAGSFTLAEAEALVGPGDHGRMIDEVERRGLLMRYRSGADEAYRYHPVVRDVLSAALAAQFPGDLARLHGIVARSRFARGEHVDAFHHALLARDYPLATEVLTRGGTVLLRSGGGEAVITLPLRVAFSYPLLAMARGLAENARGRHWVAREFFGAALVAGRSRSQRNPAERATLAVAQSVILRISGKPQDAARVARTALELIERAGADAFGEQLTELYALCAATFFQAESWDEASRVLERVPFSSPRGGMLSASLQAAMAALRGTWDTVGAIRAEVERIGWPDASINTYPGALLHFAEMSRALLHGDTATVRERLALWEPRTALEFRVPILTVGYLADVLDGAPERTVRSLGELREFELGRNRLSEEGARTIAFAEAIARVATGDFAGAERLVARQRSVWAASLRAHIALLQRDDAKAVRALADSALSTSVDPRAVVVRHLLLAWRSVLLGDEASAARNLGVLSHPGEAALVRDLAIVVPGEVRRMLAAALPADSPLRQPLEDAPESPFSERLARRALTEREVAVLLQLRAGGSNADIARALNISTNTLKAQLRSAYLKLGVSSREDALARVAELGLQPRVPTGVKPQG
ncbi:LuxR C-terminal-related transcriptional regulator [Schumannella luteola]